MSDSGNEELLNKVAELEKRLEEAKSEQLAEREKVNYNTPSFKEEKNATFNLKLSSINGICFRAV